jgi:CelD/BcsL family acetyltransferase involved in cellulose biosynthesis
VSDHLQALGDDSSFEPELLSTPDDLTRIEHDWRRLAEAQGSAFLTPEWYRAWLRHYGAEAEPAVVVVRDALGRVNGVMPMARSTSGINRQLRFGGANLGDWFGPASVPGTERAVAVAAARALDADTAGPTIVLDNVSGDASWWRDLKRALPDRMSVATLRTANLPRIELRGLSWDDFLGTRSRNLRSQVRRKTRALERESGFRFRLVRDRDRVIEDLETCFRLHDQRWSNRGGSSSLTELSRVFHRDFAHAAFDRGWLRLWLLEVRDQAVAGFYGWRLGDHYAYYMAGFAPEWSSRSVGFVLLAQTIRSAIEEGSTTYELLLGEEAYKSRFATSAQPVKTVVLTRSTHPFRFLIGAEAALWRLGRRLPPTMRGRARRAYRTVSGHLPTGRAR